MLLKLLNVHLHFVGSRYSGWLQECQPNHLQELQEDQWDVACQNWWQKSVWQSGIWRRTGKPREDSGYDKETA